MTDTITLTSPLVLPHITAQRVTPSLQYKGKIYAHDVTATFLDGRSAVLDARQLPVDVAGFRGQTAMAGIYIVSFLDIGGDAVHKGAWTGRYLGLQNSIPFFPQLLNRDLALENNEANDDEDVFQNDYDAAGDAYLALGFPLQSYEQVPMIETDQGVLFLGLQAHEQLAAAGIACGDTVAFGVESFSLVSFNPV